jgi:RNA recognition motif-containing protein
MFKPYGELVSVAVVKKDDGLPKGFGFVCFKNPEDAITAQQ